MTNGKSHTPFRLMSKSTTLDDRERQYALCCWKDASFGANHKNLNENRPTLSAAKCRPMTLVSEGIRFVQIFAEVLGERRQTTVGLSTTAIFSVFPVYFSDTLEMRPALGYYIAICSPSSAFHRLQNAWPWMTLTGYFTLNSVFAPVWLADSHRLRK